MTPAPRGCPCGSGAAFEACCGPIIGGTKAAPTAEALMRSRYTAFATGNLDHIEKTYAAEKRRDMDHATSDGAPSIDWIGLEIIGTSLGREADQTGIVKFAARYRKDGKNLILHERSNFVREDGVWVYVDGEIIPTAGLQPSRKMGRNEPCPCGSGKKYKKCCGA